MPRKLWPHPKYRDSGIPWLGEVPAHWEVQRLKRVARLNPGKGEARDILNRDEYVTFLPMEKVSSEGQIDSSDLRPAGSVWDGFTYFRKDDVILAKITPCFENGKGACLDSLPTPVGFGSTEFIVLRPKANVTGQFLYRITSLAGFRQLGADEMTGSAGQQRVPNEFVSNFVIPLPPLSEQEHIVRFLDRVDELVDRLISTKRRLIEVLTEQKQAVIHNAVTRGLDPDVPMKPTGLDWLPEVPENWQVVALRLRYSTELGKMLDAKRITGAHSVPYLRNVDIQWDRVGTAGLPSMDIEPHEYDRYTLRPGDMLVCEGGEVGRSAFWNGELQLCGYQKALHRVRVLEPDRDSPRFLYYLMYATAKLGVFQAGGSENTIAHLTGEKLRAHRFSFPPKEEQEMIVRHLGDATAYADKAIARARREIELIREYRTRLISDVVTGKMDVREEVKATKPKKANKYFHRVVLAAEIVNQYHGLSRFGWIKLQKTIILAERHLQMDEIRSEPKRAAAGPFDNPMMRSIHKQLAAQKWFEPIKNQGGRVEYVPMENRGAHEKYFETYWGDRRAEFDRLLKLLRPADTDQAEILATMYMVWNDFLTNGESVDDDKLVHEVLHNWDESKRRFSEERWRRAISWMRKNDLVPQGFGTVTTSGPGNAID